MVLGSTKTYGELMQEAASLTDNQEVGETLEAVMDRFKNIIEDAVQKNYEKGVTGKYYIHIWVQKEPYANNTIRIYPQCRRTRPSPYQGNDHYLWQIEDGGRVTFQWCIPRQEILSYVLANPEKYDVNYVRSLRAYVKGNIENISDYMTDGEVI